MHKTVKNNVLTEQYDPFDPLDQGSEFETNEQYDSSNNMDISRASQAAFLLKLSQRFHLPYSGIGYVINSTRQFIDEHLNVVRKKITSLLGDAASEVVSDCENLFDSANLFSGFENISALQNFYEKLGLFVRPKTVRLGLRCVKALRQGNRVYINKLALGYIVPFEAKLVAFLKMPEVRLQRTSINRDRRRMFSVLDGDYFKSCNFLQDHPDALVFMLYSDEVELVNPLGTNVKKHKLIMFFWTLLNLSPEYLSGLSAANLLAVARSCDVKQFGLRALLSDFIESMQRLSVGTQLLIDDSVRTIFGMLGPSVTVEIRKCMLRL
jgi:hypothetical protein